MRYLLTEKQMRVGDDRTIHEFGVPSMVLMERAALKSVEVLEEAGMDCSEVLVVCGSGNNGGDGFAIARLLHLKGYNVYPVFVGNETSRSEETKQQMGILEKYGVSIGNTIEKREYSVIIDAVFGIGITREITGHYADVIKQMNRLRGGKAAIDIPSGIDAAGGQVMGTAFRADLTVTFACEKLGTVLFPGCEYAGRTVVTDIGIDPRMFENDVTVCHTYELSDLPFLIPRRRVNSHKGTYGKVLMITGSSGMAGAAYLSAKAAYETGAGLIRIYTAEENQTVLQTLLPEAIIKPYAGYDRDELRRCIDQADVVAVGCGLGKSETAVKLLTETVSYCKKPCIIDADGINILSEQKELIKGGNFLLTPHLKEMSRLIKQPVEEIAAKRFEAAGALVRDTGIVCVLKDARTVVAAPEQPNYLNTSGNAAMAKAGAGDVLTGIITALLAQGMTLSGAGKAGVFLHGLSGDAASRKKGSYSVSATDLTEAISNVLKKMEES